MSKWTSEEVREKAHAYSLRGDSRTAAMLDTLAERIASDEAEVNDEVVQKVAHELDELFAVEDAQEPAFLHDVRRILTSVWPNPPAKPHIDLAAIREVAHAIENHRGDKGFYRAQSDKLSRAIGDTP